MVWWSRGGAYSASVPPVRVIATGPPLNSMTGRATWTSRQTLLELRKKISKWWEWVEKWFSWKELQCKGEVGIYPAVCVSALYDPLWMRDGWKNMAVDPGVPPSNLPLQMSLTSWRPLRCWALKKTWKCETVIRFYSSWTGGKTKYTGIVLTDRLHNTYLRPGLLLPALIFVTEIGCPVRQLRAAEILRICPPWNKNPQMKLATSINRMYRRHKKWMMAIFWRILEIRRVKLRWWPRQRTGQTDDRQSAEKEKFLRKNSILSMIR